MVRACRPDDRTRRAFGSDAQLCSRSRDRHRRSARAPRDCCHGVGVGDGGRTQLQGPRLVSTSAWSASARSAALLTPTINFTPSGSSERGRVLERAGHPWDRAAIVGGVRRRRAESSSRSCSCAEGWGSRKSDGYDDAVTRCQAKALYALEIHDGTLPGPYTDTDAEDYARRAIAAERPRVDAHRTARVRGPLTAAAMTRARRQLPTGSAFGRAPRRAARTTTPKPRSAADLGGVVRC